MADHVRFRITRKVEPTTNSSVKVPACFISIAGVTSRASRRPLSTPTIRIYGSRQVERRGRSTTRLPDASCIGGYISDDLLAIRQVVQGTVLSKERACCRTATTPLP